MLSASSKTTGKKVAGEHLRPGDFTVNEVNFHHQNKTHRRILLKKLGMCLLIIQPEAWL